MSVDVPVDWVQSVAGLRFPAKADHRLQELMERNNEGLLNDDERKALEALVELNEEISLVRSGALRLLRHQK